MQAPFARACVPRFNYLSVLACEEHNLVKHLITRNFIDERIEERASCDLE
jgi:hypothetical protein